MAKHEDDLTKTARRGAAIDGTAVLLLGFVTLAVGSDPDQSTGRTILWLCLGVAFGLALAWTLFRAFRRADEYQRRIQLESMAIAFGLVLMGIHVSGLLDAAGIGQVRQHIQIVFIGGLVSWMLIADLRTRYNR